MNESLQQELIEHYNPQDDQQFRAALEMAQSARSDKSISFDSSAKRVKVQGQFDDDEKNARVKEKYLNTFSAEEEKDIQNAGGKIGSKKTKEGKRSARRAQIRAKHEEGYGQHLKDMETLSEAAIQSTIDEMLSHRSRMNSISDLVTSKMKGTQLEGANDCITKINVAIENIIIMSREAVDYDPSQRTLMLDKLMKLEDYYSLVYKYSLELCDQFTTKDKENSDVADSIQDLQTLSEAYQVIGQRLESVTMKILDKKEKNSTWGKVIQRAQGKKTKALKDTKKAEGGAMSDVVVQKKEHGGKTERSFIKRQEYSGRDFYRLKMNLIDSLTDPASIRKMRSISDADMEEFYKNYTMQHPGADMFARRSFPSELYDGKKFTPLFIAAVNDLSNGGAAQKTMKFVLYGRRERGQYKAGSHNADITKNNLASSKVARMFGAGDSFVRAEEASITKGEGKNASHYQGIVMGDSKGIGFYDLAEKLQDVGVFLEQVLFAPNVYKELLNIQMMDNITGQADRHADNIHCTAYELSGKDNEIITIKGVKCIDNDMAFGTHFDFDRMQHHNTSAVLKRTSSGAYEFALKAIDKGMFDKFKKLTGKDMELSLMTYLDKTRLDATLARFYLIKMSVLGKEAFKESEGASRYSSIVECIGRIYPGAIIIVNGVKDVNVSNPRELSVNETEEQWAGEAEKGWAENMEGNFIKKDKSKGMDRDYFQNIIIKLKFALLQDYKLMYK